MSATAPRVAAQGDGLKTVALVASSQSAPPVADPPVTASQSGEGLSLHERIMAEQGHDPAAEITRRKAAAAAAAAAPPATTAPVANALPAGEPTSTVLTGGQTSLQGVWAGTADRLAAYLLAVCPSPRFTIPTSELAKYYVQYCDEAGLRADLLWAQMIHETGYGMYGGDVSPSQNNFAGIGATGGGASGIAFATAEAGVMAQVAHMVAYVYVSSPVAWADGATDPRFDMVNPRGTVSVLSDLDGRWAVPGDGYGTSIEAIARAINAG
jgi:hypothetical protein